MNLTSNITTSNASKMIRLHTFYQKLLVRLFRLSLQNINTENSITIICETNIIFNIIIVMLTMKVMRVISRCVFEIEQNQSLRVPKYKNCTGLVNLLSTSYMGYS